MRVAVLRDDPGPESHDAEPRDHAKPVDAARHEGFDLDADPHLRLRHGEREPACAGSAPALEPAAEGRTGERGLRFKAATYRFGRALDRLAARNFDRARRQPC